MAIAAQPMTLEDYLRFDDYYLVIFFKMWL